MKCPKCGAEVSDSAKFCTSCGTNLLEKVAEQKDIKVEEMAEDVTNKVETQVEDVASGGEQIVEETAAQDVKFTKKIESNVKKKKHTGLKVVLIILLILILLVAGCYGLYKLEVLPESMASVFETVEEWFGKEDDDESEKSEESNKDKKKENTVTNEVKEEKKEKAITKVDEDEDLVYDAINKTISGNTYKVPSINIDSIYVENCNSQILGYIESELKLYEKATKLPDDLITTCDYYWAQNDNILSVVFFIAKAEVDEYHTFNVDVYTGDIITNSEILEAAKIDEYDLSEKGSEAAKDFYENYAFDSSIDKYKTSSEYEDAYESTMGSGNFDRYMNMFLNKNGELCVVSKISIPNRYESDNFILNIENKKRNSKQLFEGTNFPITDFKMETDEEVELTDN